MRAAALGTVMKLARGLGLLVTLGALSGCAELRARSHAREGNQLYRDGNYEAAVREFEAAERLFPDLPVVALNKGLACRQLMIPGSKSPESQRAVDCALEAFRKLKELRPDDPRGDQLYVQTLFDGDRYETLAAMYEKQHRENPKELVPINGLIQVYTRWDRPDDALRWTMRRAEVQPQDAEAQYAVGVFLWNELFQKGGAGDKATYDPRPEAANPAPPPVFGEGDIVGEKRVELADLGIKYLEKALSLRPTYREAMVYMNLLYRQKSIAYFDEPAKWQAAVDAAETWRKKAMESDLSAKGTAP
nr:MAG: hypothetical protein DIU78_06480 [Pseudomonadota bacterium]